MKSREELERAAQAALAAFEGGEKTTQARMALPPQEMPSQEPSVRRRNTDEVAQGLTPSQAVLEANRCLQCPTQPCREGCHPYENRGCEVQPYTRLQASSPSSSKSQG